MKFNIKNSHMFFDRYSLTEEERLNESRRIIEIICCEEELDYAVNNNELEIKGDDIFTHVKVEKMINILKEEFFIILGTQEEYTEDIYEISLMEKADKYVKEHYLYETLTAENVCRKLGVSRRALDNLFMAEKGKSLCEYIKYIRVEKAKEHIATGNKLENVAVLCGFGTLKTMQRCFKNIDGRPPSFYKKTVKQSDMI